MLALELWRSLWDREANFWAGRWYGNSSSMLPFALKLSLERPKTPIRSGGVPGLRQGLLHWMLSFNRHEPTTTEDLGLSLGDIPLNQLVERTFWLLPPIVTASWDLAPPGFRRLWVPTDPTCGEIQGESMAFDFDMPGSDSFGFVEPTQLDNPRYLI